MRIPFFGARALAGAPKMRREKFYTSAAGYVYSYYYLGHRPRRRATEYVFEAAADRRSYALVSVVLPDAVFETWAGRHGRALEATERYALAKLALQRAFDGCAPPQRLQRKVAVAPSLACEILDALGIE
jgi:hypothetical protein